MLRLLKLELGKIFKPVITTTAILTVLTCILTCVLQRDYTVYFHIDAWEIGTEYIALLFPLFVTIPVCWQLYYERRDRFIVYTLPRISKQKYLSIKWAACALSGFCILFIPYVMSLLCALYVVTPANVLPPHDKYSHFLLTLYLRLTSFCMESAIRCSDNDLWICAGPIFSEHICNFDSTLCVCHFRKLYFSLPFVCISRFSNLPLRNCV